MYVGVVNGANISRLGHEMSQWIGERERCGGAYGATNRKAPISSHRDNQVLASIFCFSRILRLAPSPGDLLMSVYER